MYFTASHYPRGFTKKTLLILQLIAVLFFCTCLTASAGKLERRVILSAENMKNPIKVSDLLYAKNISPAPIAIITGTVKDALGNPLVGVSVIVKGTQKGTSTSADGSFSIDANAGDVLEFTIVGYQKQEVSIGQNKNLTVVMEVEAIAASEVVVVGYGTQKKANLTGAVDQVGGEVFENRPIPNITQGLQGVMPNLNITLADGKPYRNADYQIRGMGSVGQGGSALILIDGVEGDPSTLNPNDIASVSILKDASSAAVYGARGAFGVVLITTKDPKKGRSSVSYNGNVSFKSPTVIPDLVTDPILYTNMFVEAYSAYYDYTRTPTAFHTALPYSQDWYNELLKHTPGSGLPDVMTDNNGNYQYFGSTDWMHLLYKDHLLQHDHNVTIQGGSDKATFLVSGRYYNQEGLFRYNSDDYTGVNLRAKASAQIFSWLNVDNNFSFSDEHYFFPTTISNGTVWYSMGSDSQPISTMFNPDGTLTQGAAYGVGDLWYGKNGIKTKKRTLTNTTSFKASFFEDQFRIRGDFTFRNTDFNELTKRVPVPFISKEGVISYLGAATNDLTETNRGTDYLATNLYMEYEKTFGGAHYFKGLLGYNYEQSVFNSLSSFRNGLIFPDAESLSLASGGSVKVDNSYNKWRIAGSFFRFNYNYKERYLLEVNGRLDGSSKFPVNEQVGFFPSVSAAWRLTEEPFWKTNPNGISNLKIRGSYGSLGNGNVAPYSFMELFNIQTMARLISGQLQQATSIPPVIPDGLTWETATTGNIGLDLGLLNNRLELTGDAYVRKTKNMFATGVDLPAVFGASAPRGNYADMTTRGWEISLGWRDQFALGQKPFRYNIKATLSDNKSVIDKYTNADKNLGAVSSTNTPYYVGMTLGEIWGFETEGFFTSEDDIQKHASQDRFTPSATKLWLPGDIKFKDLNGDGEISTGENRVDNHGDRKIIGNLSPRYAFSLNLGGEWNGFFLSVFLQGIGKQDYWPGNDNLYFWGQYNRPYNLIPKSMVGNIWSEDNPNTYFPRYRGYVALQGSDRELSVIQTRYLQNVAYIRLKNLQVGYNFTSSWIKSVGLKSARVYASGENLWSWSPMYRHTKDIDVAGIYGPDQDATASSDIEGGKDDHISGGANVYNYPILKSISFGLSLTF
jgi:TonB-linked SusC/RagA family outer membrane protein